MMTKIYRYKTCGEHVAVQETAGGYLMSGPLTPEQEADCRSNLDDVTIDGEIVETLDADLEDITYSAADHMGLNLVCREVTTPVCDSGRVTSERCQWSGEADELTEIEYMPEDLRASHTAAGNRGVYPANGASRIHVCQDCREALVDDDWCTEV